MDIVKKAFNNRLSRVVKRILLLMTDFFMLLVANCLSVAFLAVVAKVPVAVFFYSLIVGFILYLLFGIKFTIYSVLTRFTSHRTIVSIVISLLLSYSTLAIVSVLLLKDISYRFLVLNFIFASILLTLPRIVWRSLYEYSVRGSKKKTSKIKTLVVGAGEEGALFARTVLEKSVDIEIIGFIDSDPNKHNTTLYGRKVFGNRNQLANLVEQYDVEQVTIAIPSLKGIEREKLLELCNDLGVKVNNMPSVEELILGNVSSKSLQNIDIADLLGREEIVLNQSELTPFLKNKVVLVTGAGGSIGSEICRQIIPFSPKTVLLLGHGENSIYQIHRELKEKKLSHIEIVPLIADIQDRAALDRVFKTYRPNLVFHAAAHKHVPLMEENPYEAVKNNIFGTKNVAEIAKSYSVEKFVMISTDKAVNPPNVMGATKRVAEMIVTGLNEDGHTQFVAVRFGNVLGSRGSVIPLFKEQIAKGGPVTVTDFRMTRYFMTIPEASRLVIQAGQLARGGEIFVLDMGEPVHILDLARKIIKLSGHTEEEIKIVESGIRPGEKLYEELLSSEERVSKQIFDKIFIGRVKDRDANMVAAFIDSLSDKGREDLRESLIYFAKQD